MAKRQSLKELQERLAQRLTAAKSEALTATWLAIEAGGRRYLLPLVQPRGGGLVLGGRL